MYDKLEKFLYYNEVIVGKSYNTIKSYKKDITQFIEYLINNEKINDFEEIEIMTVRSFIAYLNSEYNINKRSINRKISSLRSFFAYMQENNMIKENKLVYVNMPKFEVQLPNILNKEDINKLREVIKIDNILGIRDRAIIELLYSSGIRSQELIDLSEYMLDFEEMEIRVIGKGDKERISFFSNNAKKWLLEYLYLKEKNYKNYNKDIVFTNNRGYKLTTRSLRRIISNYAKMTNINKDITPHIFRHSFATELLNNGVDIRYVQELLGHSSIATTQFYTHITKKLLKDVYLKTHPLIDDIGGNIEDNM